MSTLAAVLLTIHCCGIVGSYFASRFANALTGFGQALGWPGKTQTRLQTFLWSLVWEIPLGAELCGVAWDKLKRLNQP